MLLKTWPNFIANFRANYSRKISLLATKRLYEIRLRMLAGRSYDLFPLAFIQGAHGNLEHTHGNLEHTYGKDHHGHEWRIHEPQGGLCCYSRAWSFLISPCVLCSGLPRVGLE